MSKNKNLDSAWDDFKLDWEDWNYDKMQNGISKTLDKYSTLKSSSTVHKNKLLDFKQNCNVSLNNLVTNDNIEKKLIRQDVNGDVCGEKISNTKIFNIQSENSKYYYKPNDIHFNDVKPSYCPLITANGTTIERTYDEPCVDLPQNRSWLCCPGSRPTTNQPEEKEVFHQELTDVSLPPAPTCTLKCLEHCVCVSLKNIYFAFV